MLLFHLQRADLAMGDITITHARKTAMDFSTPFMTLGKECVGNVSNTQYRSFDQHCYNNQFIFHVQALVFCMQNRTRKSLASFHS